MAGIKCATCPHLIHERPLYWCGLERTENSDADVSWEWDKDSQEWKPFMYQPKWCRLRRKRSEHAQEEIKVGDEVTTASGKAVVTGVGPVHFEYVYADGSHGYDEVKNVTKTGRHFPELVEVLRKLKESE